MWAINIGEGIYVDVYEFDIPKYLAPKNIQVIVHDKNAYQSIKTWENLLISENKFEQE